MKSLNKSIDVTKVDSRLMVELENRKEMASKADFKPCGAQAFAVACGANK